MNAPFPSRNRPLCRPCTLLRYLASRCGAALLFAAAAFGACLVLP